MIVFLVSCKNWVSFYQYFCAKVECNRTVEEIAVDTAGEEAEQILNTYNTWIQQAIGTLIEIFKKYNKLSRGGQAYPELS